MYRLSLSLIVLSLFMIQGCAGNSARNINRAKVAPCFTTPCGGEVVSPDMIIKYEIIREVSGDYVLSGTAMPRGMPRTTQVDLAVLSIELVRDITIFESYSFPMSGRDLTQPLHFRKRFTPDGGFDGITLNWDIRYVPQ
jgi:hypothetical protein